MVGLMYWKKPIVERFSLVVALLKNIRGNVVITPERIMNKFKMIELWIIVADGCMSTNNK